MSALFANYVMAQDIIVKKDGTFLTVYNLEESSTSYFFTLEPSKDAPTQKISKDDVFSIKKSDGTTVVNKSGSDDAATKKGVPTHDPVTAKYQSDITVKKKTNRCFTAQTPDGKSLNYEVLSESDHTLAVIKGEYKEASYVIPEYVDVNGVTYTVTEIGEEGFSPKISVKAVFVNGVKSIVYTNIQFPNTLKKIGNRAFSGCELTSIVLPEGLEEIGEEAFRAVSFKTRMHEIYLPSSLKDIGSNCFLYCGKDCSYRGYCQAYFSNMPVFITEGNCKSMGIDEEAVRAFMATKK